MKASNDSNFHFWVNYPFNIKTKYAMEKIAIVSRYLLLNRSLQQSRSLSEQEHKIWRSSSLESKESSGDWSINQVKISQGN